MMMKMKHLIPIFSLLFFALTFSACKKNEGQGGKFTVTGKIHAQKYDGAGNLLTEYDADKEDVFIIYGSESTTQNDDVKTSYDGTFQFEYLEEGTYKIYVYEKCTNCPSGKDVIIQEISFDKKASADLGTNVQGSPMTFDAATNTIDIGTINIRQ